MRLIKFRQKSFNVFIIRRALPYQKIKKYDMDFCNSVKSVRAGAFKQDIKSVTDTFSQYFQDF